MTFYDHIGLQGGGGGRGGGGIRDSFFGARGRKTNRTQGKINAIFWSPFFPDYDDDDFPLFPHVYENVSCHNYFFFPKSSSLQLLITLLIAHTLCHEGDFFGTFIFLCGEQRCVRLLPPSAQN